MLSLINNYYPVDDDSGNPRRILMWVVKCRPVGDLLWVKNSEIRSIALAQETTVHQSQSRS